MPNRLYRGFWKAAWLAVVALLLASVAAAAQATPDATPGANGPLATLAPPALYKALLAAPFPVDRFPVAATSVEVVPWQDDSDDDLAGALGGALVMASGADSSGDAPGIAFVVFPKVEDAERRLTESVEAAVADGADVSAVDRSPDSARLIIYDDYAVGVARLDYVLVSGFFDLTDADQPAAANDAVALAQAGVEHLRRLASQLPDATPSASPSS